MRSTQPKDMTPAEITYWMKSAGVSQTQIAKDLSITQPTISRVISGRDVSDRVRRAIAEAIGIDVKRIWPSTYLYGSPRKPGRPKTYQD